MLFRGGWRPVAHVRVLLPISIPKIILLFIVPNLFVSRVLALPNNADAAPKLWLAPAATVARSEATYRYIASVYILFPIGNLSHHPLLDEFEVLLICF